MAKHLAEPDEDQPRVPIWRTKVALSAVLMLAIVIGTVFAFRWLVTDQPGSQDTTIAVNNSETDSLQTEPAAESDTKDETDRVPSGDGSPIIMHVAGEVQNPGIVELSDDARVVDAIEAAGGPTAQAQLDALNLAAVAADGDYILVPNRDADGTDTDANPPAAAGPADAGTGTVNINTGDTAALETLPGVGPATAAQIIAHREQHGAFKDLASLEEVSGIGPATRERLDGLVSW